jgi:hypothetical protein
MGNYPYAPITKQPFHNKIFLMKKGWQQQLTCRISLLWPILQYRNDQVIMQLGYIKRKRERLMTKHYRILDEYFMCFNGLPWSEGAIMCGVMNLFYFQYVKQTRNALRFLGLNHQVGLDFIAWVWDRNWLCPWNVSESSGSFASFISLSILLASKSPQKKCKYEQKKVN